jgi:hypothetical protein
VALLGTQDKAIPPALQRFMAERANATIVEWRPRTSRSCPQPEAATQLILQAVETTAAARWPIASELYGSRELPTRADCLHHDQPNQSTALQLLQRCRLPNHQRLLARLP